MKPGVIKTREALPPSLQVTALQSFVLPANPVPNRNSRAGREMYAGPITCPAGAEVRVQHNLGRMVSGMQVVSNQAGNYLPNLAKTATISTTAIQSIIPSGALLNAIVRFW